MVLWKKEMKAKKSKDRKGEEIIYEKSKERIRKKERTIDS